MSGCVPLFMALINNTVGFCGVKESVLVLFVSGVRFFCFNSLRIFRHGIMGKNVTAGMWGSYIFTEVL